MASGAVIGALRVDLGANTAELEKGLKDASSALSRFAQQASTIAAGIGLEKIVERIAGSIANAFKHGFEQADKLGKMAQSIGIPVEELSKLKHAADLSDVSIETLGSSLNRLSRNMMQVATGAETEAGRAFAALGIQVKNADGSLKSSSAVLSEIAAKFATYKDSAEKTALAMAIFGRSGAQLIPLLNSGADGIKQMTEEAEKLGIVIDAKTAKAAEGFNDNLTRLKAATNGIITQVTARMAPAFESLSQMLVDAAKSSGFLDTAAAALTLTLRNLVTAGIIVGSAFKAVGQLLASVASAMVKAAVGDFEGALAALGGGVIKWVDTTEGAVEAIKKVWADAAPDDTLKINVQKKVTAPLLAARDAAGGAKDALERFFTTTAKRLAGMEAEARTVGLSVDEHERLKFVLQAETIAKENNITVTDALKKKIEEMGTTVGLTAQKVDDSKKLYDRIKSAAEGVRSSMESAFVDAVTGAKSFSAALKGLLGDLKRLAAQQIFRMIFGAGSGAGEGIFGSIASGLFKAAPKAASGGSFTVPGGSSGIDSKLAMIGVAPGERIDVRKAGESGPMGGSFAPVYNIDARGADQGTVARIQSVLQAHAKQIGANARAMSSAQHFANYGVARS